MIEAEFFNPSGKTEIPFDITLKPHGNRQLYETYHGVFINIQVILEIFYDFSSLASLSILALLVGIISNYNLEVPIVWNCYNFL